MADAARAPISGCVICYQEADRIADCLRSLSFCDEVVVVDSGSTDGTPEIAERLGARLVSNAPFPGHKQQKQFAVEQARHDLVFCLDADERCTPELAARISVLQRDGLAADGYEMPRHNHYLGRMLRHGLHVPDRKLRLFDRRKGRWGGRNPHDHVEMQAGARVERLVEGIEHLSYRDFAHHRRTIDSFTRIAAEAMAAEGRRATPLDLLVRPPAVFVKSLLLKLGFLDGWRGFAVAGMAAYTDWIKYWRLLRQPRRRAGEAS
ncbi:MAG: glycosyltransferase family 2 protein [Planctomycetes bacterium]|nr:glycosyltransferase family 2 protein [Planctomycetota bacterium]